MRRAPAFAIREWLDDDANAVSEQHIKNCAFAGVVQW
jgi:hypothetical protein